MWCSTVNYILLVIWFLLIISPHGWMLRVLRIDRKMTEADFDRINVAGLVYFKAATILFFVVPFFVVYSVNHSTGLAP